jgi:hydroxymethylpyrimidine pyrophosphatase-like HAD family hydrolase
MTALQPLLVCLDVDGTLMFEGAYYADARNLVAGLMRRKVLVGLCSARPIASLRTISRDLGDVNYISAFQGTLVECRRGQMWQVLQRVELPSGAAASAVQACAGKDLEVWVYDSESWWVVKYSPWTRREGAITRMNPRLGDLSQVDHALKILFVGYGATQDAERQLAQTLAGHRLRLDRSSDWYFEVTARSLPTDQGLVPISQHAGIPLGSVAAAGDNINDLGMLSAAA